MKKLVIIPTFNELENIKMLLLELINLNTKFDILIVDDSSPDGTADEVLRFRQAHPQVFLLKRDKKEGLGKAYIAGFKWALDNYYDAIIEMDADFSHSPLDLLKLLMAIENNPVVIGSRYVPEGKTVNWGFFRKLISQGGGIYSRLILGYPIKDWTGGFNGWHAQVLKDIGLDDIQSNGYSFQIELKYKALKKGYPVLEIPITFEDRRVGQSKMTFKIVLEAFYRVWLIRHL